VTIEAQVAEGKPLPVCKHCGADWTMQHKDDCPTEKLRRRAQTIMDTIRAKLTEQK
jgi:predicted metal-binding protein